jgi:hypothetical protein
LGKKLEEIKSVRILWKTDEKQTYLDCVLAIFFVMRSIARLSFLCAWVVSLAMLDLVKINGVFPELCENEGHRVLNPESLPFERRACLELLIVLDGIGYFATALRSFLIDRIVEVAGPFIADSHGIEEKITENARDRAHYKEMSDAWL